MMTTDAFDRVPDATLQTAARTGRVYSNEAKSMARELLELRAKLAESSAPTMDIYSLLGP